MSDDEVVDLGAVLCLDRGPTVSVVAARPGVDFAGALSAVESGPIREARPDDVPVREWVPLSRDTTHLIDSAAAGTGFVIVWPVRGYPEHSANGRSLAQLRERVRSVRPESALVILVETTHAVDAIAVAADVARRVELNGSRSEVGVYSLVRPGDDDGDDEPVPSVAPGSPGRLMSTVAARMHGASLQPGYVTESAPLPDDADPVSVAASVIDMLNDHDTWGNLNGEAHAIGLVRDYAPRFFGELIRQHAASRRGSARWASLAACAEIDDHVDLWLEGAGGFGDADEIPPALRLRPLVAAVGLAILRTGASIPDTWADLIRTRAPSIWTLAGFLGSARPASEFVAGADVDMVTAADRADRRDLLTGPVTAPEASAAWWRALGRLPLTARRVGVVARLSAESRRIPGFTTSQDEPDADFAELAYEMRLAFRSGPMAKEPNR